MEDAVAATKDKEQENIFSDEMVAAILDAEAYMEDHPNDWTTIDELKTELSKI